MKTIKNYILNKKIVAILLLLITILTNISPVFAVSGSGSFVGGQYASGMLTTDHAAGSTGVLIRRLINNTTGERYTVFCAEHGVDFKTGSSYNGNYYTPTDATIKRACKIAYFGWYKDNGGYVVDGGILANDMKWVKQAYVFTQQYIWETLGQSNATFRDSTVQADYVAFKNDINNKINNMQTRPSFDATTIEIDAGETKVLNDTNGVLADYSSIDNTKDNVRFQHNKGENTLTITVSEDCTVESLNISDSTFQSWGLVKEESRDQDTTVYFSFTTGVQDQLMALHYNDPVPMAMSLKINLFGNIELTKLSDNNDLINSAVFNVTGPNNYNQDVTVTNGKITIDKLRAGTYTIKEKSAPEGYLLNPESYQVEVKAAQTSTKTIIDAEPTGKILLYKVSENNDKISGAVFKVTAAEKITNKAGTKTFYTEGQEVATITTASGTGIAQIDNLPLGKYYVKEVQAPTGYLLNENTYTANLVYKDDTTPVVELKIEGVKDIEPTGKIVLYKVSENNDKIGGAVFKVTAAEKITNKAGSKTFYSEGQEVATITTASGTGIAQIDNLPLGKYYVKEVQAPTGYLLNENTYTANLVYKNDTTPVITIEIKGIVDEEPTGTISIIKKDSKTGSIAQGDATLKNAVYKVYAGEDIYNVAKSKKFYSKGDLVATRNTDEKGACQDITDLPLGKYIVKEETAPIGYLIDTKEYEVNLKYKDQYTKIITGNANSTDKVKEMRVHIFKSGIDVNSGKTPGLAGAIFTIKLNSAVQRAYDKGYTYAEVWGGIDEYGNAVTVDSKRVAEAQVIAPTYEAIETDENGDAYTQNVLPYGTFIVKETTTPKDYESAADFTFSITQDESEIKDIAKKVKDIVVNNEQLETYIKIIKKDKNSEKTVSLNNATFQIKATKDIYDRATGKILYKKGEVITQKVGSTTYNSFTTNADNMVVPANSYSNKEGDSIGSVITPLKLEVGSYQITEIKIPEGFLQLENPVTFKVEGIRNYDTDQDGDFILEVEVLNEQPTGTLIIDKSIALREDADTSLVDISDLSGIQFKLVAKENIIDYADGSIIYKAGQEIKTYNLNKNGDLKVEKLPMGKYQLQEIKTLDGLVLNNTIYDIEFNKQDDVTKVYTVTEDIANDTTFVEFSKTDITGEKELEGAKLTVLDKDGNVIDSWTSTDKTHKIEGLVAGKSYVLREEIAPEGFVRATNIEFKVENTKDIQKVTMIDKVVDMTKNNIAGDEVEGAKMQVFDKEGNIVDEWISGKEAHKINNLVEGEKYTLHEETAPDGYVVATDVEFEVTLDKETQHEVMTDKIVEMTKKNIAGDEVEGAKMQVFDKEGNIVDEWTSEKEAHKINNLKEGNTYILHEETAPEGYVLATDVEFTVTTDKETQHEEMIDKIVNMSKVDVAGEEIEGAKIQVFDKDGNIVDEWESGKEPHIINNLKENETYTLHEEITPNGYVKATDVEFTVTLDKETQHEEMIDKVVEMSKVDVGGDEVEGAKMQVFDKDGNIVDEWESGKEAHKINNLVEGEKYTLHEETAPNGYVVATDIEFEVTLDKETQHEIMIDKIVEMSKVDVAGEEIEGAKIQVFDKDGNIVDEWTSGKETHKINNLIEGETYTLHEEITPNGYVKATDVEFTVTLDKETQHEVMVDKIVDVTKTDLTNGEELEGAELVVTDEDGNIIDKWTSTKEPHHITGLEEGKKYTLTETTAPYGYEVAESIEFEVSFDKENQLVEMKDMPILKSVRVEKLDKDTKEHIKSNKFVFGIYEDEECTKLIKEAGANEFEGTALFDELRYGTYYIKEIKAPLGYKLSDQVVKVEINDKGVFADGVSLEEKDGIYSFEYYNSLLPKIQTGNETNYVLLGSLAVISLIGIVGGIMLLRKKHNEK